MCGVRVKHSKLQARELSEEEKAEAEAKGAKGKAPPPKGKAAKDEEPSAEELERLEKARQEKEELERAQQAEWDALDEDTKFHRTNEDIKKEPAIRMENMVMKARLERLQEQLTAMGAPGESAEPERARLEAEIAEVQKSVLVGVSVSEK